MANLQYGTYYSSQPGTGPGKKQKILIIGIIVAVLFGVIFMATSLLSGNAKNDVILLAAKESSFATLANESQKSIRDPDLATANSNAAILLTSDTTNLLSVTGTKKLDGNLVKQQADTNGERLKQASLLDKFDSTYQQVVLEKTSALTTETRTLRGKVSDKKTSAALDQVITNLDSITKQFTALQLP